MDGTQYRGTQSRWWILGHRLRQMDGDLGVVGQLRLAPGAPGEMGFKNSLFGRLQGIDGVESGQIVDVAGARAGIMDVIHGPTPKAARRFFNPSRILALAVPRGISRR